MGPIEVVIVATAAWLGIGLAAVVAAHIIAWWLGENLTLRTIVMGLSLVPLPLGPIFAILLAWVAVERLVDVHGNAVVIEGRKGAQSSVAPIPRNFNDIVETRDEAGHPTGR